MPREEMTVKRKDQDFDAKVCEQRRNRCRGEDKYERKSKPKVTTTAVPNGDFDERYIEGEFIPLGEYLEQELKVDTAALSVDVQLEMCRQQCKKDPKIGERGQWGVEVDDLKPGRYRRHTAAHRRPRQRGAG